MEISSWVCKKIAEIDPNCRIGFGAINGFPPCFAIVKLYSVRDADRFSYAPDDWRSRGPIFNRKGRTSPDWDLLARVPCNLAEVSASLVHSGEVVDTLRSWVADVRDAKYLNLKKMAEEQDASLDELSTKMADYAQWHARHAVKIGEADSSPIIARKFRDKDQEARYHGDSGEKNRYWQELEMLEYKWRAEGWKPPQER